MLHMSSRGRRHGAALVWLGTTALTYSMFATAAAAQTADQAASTGGQSTPASGSNSAPETDIVVTGVRASQRAAIAVKRAAPQIVDSIVAEDIGKLPDNTIADSLQRVPGVQITRSAGEGSGVNIRGVPQVLTTLNGEQFLGSQNIASAQPTFTDVPPALFAGVDVIKSPTAENLSGGISGILALKTRRPFDLHDGLNLAFSAQDERGARTKAWSQQLSGLVGYKGDRFGALVSVGYTDETLANYDTSASTYRKIGDTDVGFDLRGDGSVGSVDPVTGKRFTNFQYGSSDYAYQPTILRPTDQITTRKRLGISSSFQWRPTDSLTATLDVDYLQLQDRGRYVAADFHTNNKTNELQPGADVSEHGALLSGTQLLDRFFTHTDNNYDRSHAWNGSLKVDWNNGGPFRLSARAIGARSRNNFTGVSTDNYATTGSVIYRMDGGQQFANPNGVGIVPFHFDVTGKYPVLTLLNPDAVTNASAYDIQSAYASGNTTKAYLWAGRLDAEYDADWGLFKTIKAGVRYGVRNIDYNQFKYLAAFGGDGPDHLYFYKDPQITDPSFPTGIGANNYSILPQYQYSDVPNLFTRFYSYGPVKGAPIAGLPAVNPSAMDNQLAFLNSLYPGETAYTDPTASYRVKEREISGYVQADFGGNLFAGLTYSGNVGVRLVGTKQTITNFATDGAKYIGVGGSYNGVLLSQGTTILDRSYFDALPSFNLTINTAHDQKLRFAVNKAVARQNLATIAQGFQSAFLVNANQRPDLPADLQLFLSGSSGNPDLKPYRSTNYQASYEWYFARTSLLSAAAFYIDVDSFPQQTTTIEPIADGDGVVRSGGPVSRPINGGGGSIKGIELSYQQTFDFLPGFFSGFGVNLNYTYSKSRTSNFDTTGRRLPIPDNSEHQFNAILFYQKGPLQGRVAYNWRSTQFNSTIGIADASGKSVDQLGVYTKPVGFLDASLSYDVRPNFTVYLQGTDLTQARINQYVEWPELFHDQTNYERRVAIGVRVKY